VVSFTPLPLYPWEKSPQYPLDRRLSGPQSRSEYCEEEKNLALLGIEHRPHSPNCITILADLSDSGRFRHKQKYKIKMDLTEIGFRDVKWVGVR
jgi:hypothetical protein